MYIDCTNLSGEAQLSEADLIRRAQSGDGVAWEALVRAHQEGVFRLAYLLLGDADDAEDVAQETFIRAFRSLDRFDRERPLRPWLLRITANLARNRRRSLGRYLANLQRMARRDPDSIQGRVPRDVEDDSTWQAETLWGAIRRLRPTDREVITMRYFLDLSEAEMAAALDVAPGTVKSRLHRALRRLRETLERDFPGTWHVR